MSLTSIAADIRNTVQEGQAWLAKTVEEHVPALLAEAERIQSSKIFQVLEGVVLPADVEQEIANLISAVVKLLPQAPATPAAPEVPGAPPADTAG